VGCDLVVMMHDAVKCGSSRLRTQVNHEMMPWPPPHTSFHHFTEEHSRPECVVKSGQTLGENGFCVGLDLGLPPYYVSKYVRPREENRQWAH
jgi:hypothetical protein